jgi:hypothetical protein
MTLTGLIRPARTVRDVRGTGVLGGRAPARFGAGPAVGRAVAPASSRPQWWREILLVGGVYGAYEASRGLDRTSLPGALANGHRILAWERSWHVSPEVVLNHAIAHVTPLAVLAAYFYSTLHYLVTPAVLIWLYRRHPEHYTFARTWLAISTVIGLIGFYLLPTAPPRLLAGSGVHDTLADVQQWGWWSGEGSVPRGLGSLSNQFAAMPSLHVGWALWCGVLLVRHGRRRWVRVLGASYPLLTTLVVLSTGNHYLVDALAGAVTMGLGAGLTLVLRRGSHSLPGTADGAEQNAAEPAPARRACVPSGRRTMEPAKRRPGGCGASRRPPRTTDAPSSPVESTRPDG